MSINKKCKYYPCHKNLEDCSFCYCPLYPCKNEKRGKWYKGVWDCSDCEIVHKTSIVPLIKQNINYIIKVFERNE